MRIKLILGCLTVTALTIAIYGQPGAFEPQSPNTATGSSTQGALIDRYCVTCHNQRARESGIEAAVRLTLDDLDISNVGANPAVWEHVVRKLRAGMMPPSGLQRPDGATMESFIVWLENELDRNAAAHTPAPGLHRLNRTEYANVIRDLLAIEIDPAKYLPPDDSTRGFDNLAAALSLSPALMEAYISAAAKISRTAIGNVTAPTQAVYRVPEDASQEYHIEGMPFRTRGGIKIEHEFPADAEYGFTVYPVNKGNMDLNTAFGDILGEKLELLLDGVRIKLFDWDSEVARGNAVRNGTPEIRIPVKAGRHTVIATFLATHYAPGLDINRHFRRSTIETGDLPGYRFFPQLGKVMISGPYNATGATDSPSRSKIFVCTPGELSAETACAEQILNTLARRAFRRPVTGQDTGMLMGFYRQGRSEGGFDHGIEMALNRILADPEFVFRKEAPPGALEPGQPYRLTDLELASRLSFFLWSSIPDDELLDLAAENALREPGMLERQVKRMLADSRSEELVKNFAGQWLALRGLQTHIPEVLSYPDFDDNLRQAMRKEMELFFASILQEDRSVIDLLTADHTFVNERLAKHYGIPNVYGSHFRRVSLGPEMDMRRGLLGKGSFLTVSSAPHRTSPVNRGKMVMQVFLGVEPPAPPPDVPDIPQQESSVHGRARPTIRQLMEMHAAVEPCASCHKIMDPIGLSLENFDAIGRWRTTEDGTPVDASGVLVDGTSMNGVADLRQALLKYSPQFARVVTEKLLIYALGRGTEYYDMPLIRSIVRDAEATNYRFSSLVLGIVNSEPFQSNMKGQEAGR